MIEQLIKLVQQNAGEAIVKNTAIDDKFNNAAIEDVAQQIFSGLKTQVGQGNLQEVVSMFQGTNANALSGNPMVSQIIANITTSLANKFGVSPQVAQGIAASLIPQVLNKLVKKTNDPTDNDFDLQGMLKGFTGNNDFDLGSLLGKAAGGKGEMGDLGNVLGKLF